MCAVPLPPGVNIIAVDKYIKLSSYMYNIAVLETGNIVTSAKAAQFLFVRATATVDSTICRQTWHSVPLRSWRKTLTVRRLFLNFCSTDEWQLIGRDNVQAMKIHLCSRKKKQ
jgi:hypothetical protein